MLHREAFPSRDYDMPAQPVLFEYAVNGRKVPALAAPTKRGEIFILDRATGKSLTGIEERPVPRGAIPGERYRRRSPMCAVSRRSSRRR